MGYVSEGCVTADSRNSGVVDIRVPLLMNRLIFESSSMRLSTPLGALASDFGASKASINLYTSRR